MSNILTTDPSSIDFPAELRAARMKAGLTVVAMARATGMSVSLYGAFERDRSKPGATVPNSRRLVAIERALSTPLEATPATGRSAWRNEFAAKGEYPYPKLPPAPPQQDPAAQEQDPETLKKIEVFQLKERLKKLTGAKSVELKF